MGGYIGESTREQHELQEFDQILNSEGTRGLIKMYSDVITGKEEEKLELTDARINAFENIFTSIAVFIKRRINTDEECNTYIEDCARYSLISLIQMGNRASEGREGRITPAEFINSVYERYKQVQYYFLHEDGSEKEAARLRLLNLLSADIETHSADYSSDLASDWDWEVCMGNYDENDVTIPFISFGGGSDSNKTTYLGDFTSTEARRFHAHWLKHMAANSEAMDIPLAVCFDIGQNNRLDSSIFIRMDLTKSQNVKALKNFGLSNIIQSPFQVVWRSFADCNPPPGLHSKVGILRLSIIKSLLIMTEPEMLQLAVTSDGYLELFNYFLVDLGMGDKGRLEEVMVNDDKPTQVSRILELLDDEIKFVPQVSGKNSNWIPKNEIPEVIPFYSVPLIINYGKQAR